MCKVKKTVKKSIGILLALLFVLSLLPPMTARATTFEGSGTQADPWLIQSATDLGTMRDLINSQTSPWADAGVYYKLTQDIDLSAYATETIVNVTSDGGSNTGKGWTPIGYASSNGEFFKGVFDGGGHSISGLFIDFPLAGGYSLGLFGTLNPNAVIKNLHVVKCDVTGYANVAGLVGMNYAGIIEYCSVTGKISSPSTRGCGGLVGVFRNYAVNSTQIANGYIDHCYTDVVIFGAGGGLVQELRDGRISNCYSLGVVTDGEAGIGGGIVGFVFSGYKTDSDSQNSTIENCVALQLRIAGEYPYDNSITAYRGRIYGYLQDLETPNNAVFSGNSAWSGMMGFNSPLASSTGDGKNGADLTTAAACVAAIQAIGFPDFTMDDLPAYFTGYFAAGSGTESDPYQIKTADDLENLALYINNGVNFDGVYFKLMNDVDLAGSSYRNWTPIGSNARSYVNNTEDTFTFNGIFDGNGKTIRNLSNSAGSASFGQYYMGLFGRVGSNGTVKNLNLTGVNLNGYDYYVGGIAGECDGVIDNCSVSGSLQTHGYTTDMDHASVGGIVGAGIGSDLVLSNCSVTGTIGSMNLEGDFPSPYYAGGVAGMVIPNGREETTYTAGQAGLVENCDFSGDVLLSYYCSAGLIGENYATVQNCHASGTVQGWSSAAGFIGINYGTVSNCYATSAVSAPGSACGFISSNSYLYYYVTGDANAHFIGGTVSHCYSTGNVTNDSSATRPASNASGFIFGNNGTIEYCYSTGDVVGDAQLAGFVGINRTYTNGVNTLFGVIKNCYCTGTLTGTDPTRTANSSNYGYCAVFASVNYSIIQGCVALNKSITGEYLHIGRVVGYTYGSKSSLEGNYVYSGMTVNGVTVTGGTTTNNNGGDLSDWTALKNALAAIGFTNVAKPEYIPLAEGSTAPAITSESSATFTVGTAGTFAVAATGSPTAFISVSGTLPDGVTFTDNGDGTATIAGTPAAGTAGSYSLSITATNGATPDATQNFTLTVAVDTSSAAKAITAFRIDGVNGVIDEAGHTIAVTLPYGTDVTSLTPTVTVSANATVSPLSGAAQNFTAPVTYTVTAGNGSTQEYSVTVTAANLPALSGTVTLTLDTVTGQVTAVANGGNTGSAGTLTYTWSGGAAGTGTTATPTPGQKATCTVTASGVTGSIQAAITVYHVTLTVSGNQGNDRASIAAGYGKAGDRVSIVYFVDWKGYINDILTYGGAATPPDEVRGHSVGGTSVYTIAPNDASNGIIALTATFTHSDTGFDLNATVALALDPATGQVTASASGGNTGAAGTLTYSWSGGAAGGDTTVTPTLGQKTTCTVTARGYIGVYQASITVYKVSITPLGNTGTDAASIVSAYGQAGDSVSIAYTLDSTGTQSNTLTYSGAATSPAAVSTPGSGTSAYTIASGDASGGTIALTATFTHSGQSMVLQSITPPSAVTGVANGAAKTAAALGLPPSVTLVTDGGSVQATVTWDVAGSSYDPASTSAQTFTVSGTAALPADVVNTNGVSLTTSISVTVDAAPVVDKVLQSITPPSAVTGVANGAAKTAAGLGLPTAVTLVTDGGSVQATVTWDVDGSSYDPASTSAQTFTVSGTAALPAGVVNTNSVSLTTSVSVTVDAAPVTDKVLQSITPPTAVTGVANGTAKAAAALGLPAAVTLVTDGGSVQATVTWDVAGSGYDPVSTAAQTFSVSGTVSLPAGVVNTNSVSLTTAISVTVDAAPVVDKVLLSITAPSAVTGVANGTAKTAAALGLPTAVTLVTDGGNVQASVTWDVAGSSYDPASTAAQTFTVSGTVALPAGVVNTNGVSLTTSISVTVDAAPVTDKVLLSITPPSAVTGVASGTAKTAAALGLPTVVTLVTDGGSVQATVTWDVAGSSYNPASTSAQTFTVSGTVALPAGIVNTNSVSLATSISVTVDAAPVTDKVLLSITPPTAVTGVANGAAKTAAALGLPTAVTMVTDSGSVQASVTWDVAGSSYDPASTSAQTFTVSGTASLPAGVVNTNGVSLTTTISVTVDAAPVTDKVLLSITPPSVVTGVANGAAKTAAALGLPTAVTLVTDGGSVQASVTWDVAGSSYDPASTSAQTFTVNGTVSLPAGVVNTNSVSLTTAISVTVDAAPVTPPAPPTPPETTPSTPEPPKVTTTTTSTDNGTVTTASVEVTGTTTGGTTAATVTGTTMTALISDAANAESSGGSSVIAITVPAGSDATGALVTIPGSSFDSMASGTNAALQISTGIGSVTFDSTAVDSISGTAAGDVRISMSQVNTAALSQQMQQTIGDRPVYKFSVTSNGQTISSFGGGSATVSVPYTLLPGENPNAVVVYYIDAAGNLQPMQGHYDAAAGTVTFVTSHFSDYMIGYNKVAFKDVSETAWYSDAVTFIAARGITTGTSEGVFSARRKADAGPVHRHADAGVRNFT